MARPVKKKDEAKLTVVRFRCTNAEKDRLAEAAKSKSLDTSAWARSELLSLAKKIASRKD